LSAFFPVPSAARLVDIFKKSLHNPSYISTVFVSKLGLSDIHSPACGGVLPSNKRDSYQFVLMKNPNGPTPMIT
jgi:hypothetical protein